jgi:hypothetical protein
VVAGTDVVRQLHFMASGAGKGLQQLVAVFVAHAFVDILEVVQINENQGLVAQVRAAGIAIREICAGSADWSAGHDCQEFQRLRAFLDALFEVAVDVDVAVLFRQLLDQRFLVICQAQGVGQQLEVVGMAGERQ